jgi:hypothetical protein
MSADLWSCQSAGSSSARLPGSIAAEGSPRIGGTQPKGARVLAPRLNPLENYAIRPEVSGQTLTKHLRSECPTSRCIKYNNFGLRLRNDVGFPGAATITRLVLAGSPYNTRCISCVPFRTYCLSLLNAFRKAFVFTSSVIKKFVNFTAVFRSRWPPPPNVV